MNHKQKLGYTALGAGILAVGIIIGQIITPDIEAQSSGVFDKITCREIEVVDKNGKKAIGLEVSELGSTVSWVFFDQIICHSLSVRNPIEDGYPQINLDSAPGRSQLTIVDERGRTAIKLSSGENFRVGDREGIHNRVAVYSPLGKEAILLQSEAHHNSFSVQDQKAPNQSAFWMFSSNISNYKAQWIRERGRVAD